MLMFKLILIIIFAIVSAVLLIHSYMPILRKLRTSSLNNENDKISEELEILKSNVSEEYKAVAFIRLMQQSYVLVHTIINRGNNYDDKKQADSFCNSLTSDLIEKINAVEGING